MSRGRILVVDDDDSLRRVMQVQLEDLGYEVATAADGDSALRSLHACTRELVVSDLKMPGMSGIELLKKLRAGYPETIVVVVTAFGTVETAVEAMKLGAYDYITKPVHPDALELCVSKALQHLHLLEEVRTLRSTLDQKYGFENILGRSDALLYVLDQTARAAQTDATVLIHGETGTGKELLAKAIHFNSTRKDRPFVTINCGAIPRELLESELFGHVKGAFTGAVADKKGKVETADRGTVFLDEIGEMPLELQVKLLRLIQQGEIAKVGATGTINVNVRIVAATHRDLKAMIEDGTFREDLYYRLSVIPLDLPPLRERAEDISQLALHFFQKNQAEAWKARSDSASLTVALLLQLSMAGECARIGERDRANCCHGPVERNHPRRTAGAASTTTAGARFPPDGTARFWHQHRGHRKGVDTPSSKEVRLEPDTCGPVSGSEPQDANLPHGEVRTAEGTARGEPTRRHTSAVGRKASVLT